jgi:hypothetical protein
MILNLKLLAILIIFINFSLAQITVEEADSRLLKSFNDLVAEEDKFANYVQQALPNVTTLSRSVQNMPDFRAALDNFELTLINLASLDNYEEYTNMTTCTDINMKITSIEFNMRKYFATAFQILVNVTTIATQFNTVAVQYALNFHRLNTSMIQGMKEFILTYFRILNINLTYF